MHFGKFLAFSFQTTAWSVQATGAAWAFCEQLLVELQRRLQWLRSFLNPFEVPMLLFLLFKEQQQQNNRGTKQQTNCLSIAMSSIIVSLQSLQSPVYEHTTACIPYAFDLTGAVLWEGAVKSTVSSEKTPELIWSMCHNHKAANQ